MPAQCVVRCIMNVVRKEMTQKSIAHLAFLFAGRSLICWAKRAYANTNLTSKEQIFILYYLAAIFHAHSTSAKIGPRVIEFP
jgi:hypothetical protein